MPKLLSSLAAHEQLNFLLTNRIPRRLATQLMGWLSNIESPLLTRMLIRAWRLFATDLNLDESAEQEFRSLQQCFTRQLRPGLRPIDERPEIVTSPCDGIVVARGNIAGTTLYQAKGFPFDLRDLIPDRNLQERYANGWYITLRLKSSMYHRFHAPLDCRVREVTYLSGDTWNVNPIALRRIENLYCKNERAVIELEREQGDGGICLVAVAAILVASIKLQWLDFSLDRRYHGPHSITCDTSFNKGDELGCFQHGSTIIVFATEDHVFCPGTGIGEQLRMGQPLLQHLSSATSFEYSESCLSPNEVLL